MRRRLIGKGRGIYRAGSYRHRPGRECGCTHKQVHAPVLESDFLRLCKLLTLGEHALETLKQAALVIGSSSPAEEESVQKIKEANIAKAQRKLATVRFMFENDNLSQDDLLRRKQALEDEIARMREMTTDAEKLYVQLVVSVSTLTNLVRHWEISSDWDKQELARSLFEEVNYDLDTQQNVGFKLKPCAVQFLMVRGDLFRSTRYLGAPYRN